MSADRPLDLPLADRPLEAGLKETENLMQIMKEVDSDGSGVIDYTEFLAATMSKRQYFQEDVCWAAFRTFDLDGNTVVVIEHNLDVVKTADWIVDLGPEGGSGGGEIVATGTPETIAATAASYTGQFLVALLNKQPKPSKAAATPKSSKKIVAKSANASAAKPTEKVKKKVAKKVARKTKVTANSA